MTAKELLKDPAAIGTAITMVGIDHYGAEFLEYEAEVMGDALDKIAGAEVPATNKDKAAALSLLLLQGDFFVDPVIFGYTVAALGGDDDPVLFLAWDQPAPEECAWTVYEALMNVPLERGESPQRRFGRDILLYLQLLLRNAGFAVAPSPLNFVPMSSTDEVTTMLSDDPSMFEAFWQHQRNNERLVVDYVGDRVALLFKQLEGLKLENGSVDKLITQLSGSKEQVSR